MTKKTWIKVKRGLVTDPTHRIKLGECIWLYYHIIDRADWEVGKVLDWQDKAEAKDMQMSISTLRHQRRKLEEERYIKTTRRKYGLEIIITKWQNPRRHDSIIINHPYEYWPNEFDRPDMGVLKERQSDNELTLSEIKSVNESNNKSDNESDNGLTHLPLISQNHISQAKKDSRSDDRKLSGSEQNRIRKSVAEHFSTLSGIPLPDTSTQKNTKAAGSLWWSPIRNICKLVQWNELAAISLIDNAFGRLDGHVSIANPKSLEKTVVAIFGEINRGQFHRDGKISNTIQGIDMAKAVREESNVEKRLAERRLQHDQTISRDSGLQT